MSDDSGVVEVVGAILVLAAVVVFLAVFAATWTPVWVADAEAARAADVKEAVEGWAERAEDAVARDLVDRPWTRSIPVGDAGVPFFGFGAASGRLDVEATPTLTVYRTTNAVATASGALSAFADATRFPPQTYRYAGGALEVVQAEGAWVDLRTILSAEPAPGGRVDATFQLVSITGAPQSAAANGALAAVGELDDATTSTHGAAQYARLVAEGVAADGWRAAFERLLGGAGLSGSSLADCTAATTDWCFDTDTNDQDTVDLYLLDMAAGWTVVVGTVATEVRS